MAWKTGFLLFALAVSQVVADHVEVDFIENVNKKAELEGRSTRIVSGWEAQLGQHPHQVSIRMVGFVGDVSSCGGSVIHRNWICTAAHCTAGRVTIVVRAGLVNLTVTEYISESTVYYNHPSYNDQLPAVVQPNDISVVRFEIAFTFTVNLRPIRLQSQAEASRNYDGLVVYSSGYGRTWTGGATSEVLNWVYLVAVANSNCFQTFGSIINDNSICARFYNVTSQSVCQGDSGGPLVHVTPAGEPILIGVTSFVAGGDFGCHSGFPAGFIRPGPFHQWLRDVTHINFEEIEIPGPDSGESSESNSGERSEEDNSGGHHSDEDSSGGHHSDEDSSGGHHSEEDSSGGHHSEEDSSGGHHSEEDSSGGHHSEEDGSGGHHSEEDSSDKSKEGKSEEDSSSDSSSSDDRDMAKLLKRLSVKVKVNVQMDKFKKKHVKHIVHEKRH